MEAEVASWRLWRRTGAWEMVLKTVVAVPRRRGGPVLGQG